MGLLVARIGYSHDVGGDALWNSDAAIKALGSIVGGAEFVNAEPIPWVLNPIQIATYNITLNQVFPKYGSEFIESVINEPQNIKIGALFCGDNGVWILEDGSGRDLCLTGGVTIPWKTQPNEENCLAASIYDVDNCHGNNRWVTSENGNHIDAPSETILFHELGHAFHMLKGDTLPDYMDEQIRAIENENYFRDEMNLPRRSTNREIEAAEGATGCGPIQPAGGSTSGQAEKPGLKGCWIEKLIHRPMLAPQVQKLRKVRDDLLCSSILGNQVLKQVEDEYYKFSPHVVKEMQKSPPLRKILTYLVVEPFVEFFGLFNSYINASWQFTNDKFEKQVKFSLSNYLNRLHHRKFDQDQIASISRTIKQSKIFRKSSLRSLSSVELTRNPLEIFNYIGNTMEKTVPENKYLTWGFAIPLYIYWTTLDEYQDHKDGSGAAKFLAIKIDEWFDNVPISASYLLLQKEFVIQDLDRLVLIGLTNKTRRKIFAQRLLSIYGKGLSYDLKKILQKKNYLYLPK